MTPMNGLTVAQRRRIEAGPHREPSMEPEWAIIDLNLLGEAQKTASLLRMELNQYAPEHPVSQRWRRLKRELKAIRAGAAFIPDDHEELEPSNQRSDPSE